MPKKLVLARNAPWLPPHWADRIEYRASEPMMGGVERRGVTLHSEGVERDCAKGHGWLPRYVNDRHIPYHACWCGWCGYWAQMIPFHRAAKSLKGGAIVGNGASANKAGQRNIQIMLIGEADAHEFTRERMKRAWILAEIMDAHRIPWRARATWGPGASRARGTWLRSGVHGHQHSPAPYEDHTDPGRLNVPALFREARRQQRARLK